MHFRLPKPLHGWREFIGEVAIIVLGVLIALSAEQAIENWRWHEQLGAGRDALRADLQSVLANAREREAEDNASATGSCSCGTFWTAIRTACRRLVMSEARPPAAGIQTAGTVWSLPTSLHIWRRTT